MRSAVPTLSAEQRQTLAQLADELVPAAEGMPAASDVDVHAEWIDRVLVVRPDLHATLTRILDQAAGKNTEEHIRELNSEAPEDLAALGLAVTGAYYLHPEVRERLGYPGQERRPPSANEAEHFLQDGLLDPVIQRGPVYRSTDDS